MNSEYIVRASCDWAAAGNAELRWPSPVPEVRLSSGRQRAGGGSLLSSIFDISVDSIHDELLIYVLFE